MLEKAHQTTQTIEYFTITFCLQIQYLDFNLFFVTTDLDVGNTKLNPLICACDEKLIGNINKNIFISEKKAYRKKNYT